MSFRPDHHTTQMIVLGINDGHDAGATLVCDGRVVLHSNEERRRNVKNYAGVPDQSASILRLAGAGDGICASVSVGTGHDIRVVSRTPKFHSMPSGLYSSITAHLGLKPNEHEYKVMGMAPYGQAQYSIDAIRPA